MVEAVVARHADVLHPHEVPASVRHPLHADRDHAARPVELHEIRHGVRRVRTEVVQVRVCLVRGEPAVEIVFERNDARAGQLATPHAARPREFLECDILYRVKAGARTDIDLRHHAVVRDSHKAAVEVERAEARVRRAHEHATAPRCHAGRRIDECHRVGCSPVRDQHGNLGLAFQAHATRPEAHARRLHALRRAHTAPRTREHGLRSVPPGTDTSLLIHPVPRRAVPYAAVRAVPRQRLAARARRPRIQAPAKEFLEHAELPDDDIPTAVLREAWRRNVT